MLGHGKGHDCMMCNMMYGKAKKAEASTCAKCGSSFSSHNELESHAGKMHRM